MDINEIKQVPIVDFLYILGIEPVKHKVSGLWYHAPYRNDRNPSLRVSTDKNVWYLLLFDSFLPQFEERIDEPFFFYTLGSEKLYSIFIFLDVA